MFFSNMDPVVPFLIGILILAAGVPITTINAIVGVTMIIVGLIIIIGLAIKTEKQEAVDKEV